MAWKSGDPGRNTRKRRLQEGWSRGIRGEISGLHKNEQGKLLLLGELFLLWSETPLGRVLLAVGALLLAWVLL